MERAVADVELIRRQMPEAILKLDAYAASGFTSSAGDNVGGSGSGMPSSPVERALSQPDEAAQYRARLERRLADLDGVLRDLLAFQRWAMVVVREDDEEAAPVQWCEVMASVGVNQPASSFTNVNGKLDRKMHLCAWARKFVARTGELPTQAQAEAHAQGRDVRVVA